MSKHLLIDLRAAFSPADSAFGICQFTSQDGIPLTMSNGVRVDWIDRNLMAATQMGVVYLPDYIESDNEEWFKGHFAKSYLLVQNNLEINAMIMATI